MGAAVGAADAAAGAGLDSGFDNPDMAEAGDGVCAEAMVTDPRRQRPVIESGCKGENIHLNYQLSWRVTDYFLSFSLTVGKSFRKGFFSKN